MLARTLGGRPWLVVVATLAAGLGLALLLDRAAGPANAQADQVRLSAEQLLINQRISQAGVRRANEALGLLQPVRPAEGKSTGWPTAGVADGAITAPKIARGAVGPGKIAAEAVGPTQLSHELQEQLAGPPFAALNADGTIQSVPGGGLRMSRVMEFGTGRRGVGSYIVQFAADTRACPLIATLELTAAVDGDAGEIAVKEIGGVGVINGELQFFSKVAVQTRASDGTPADRSFHVAAMC
jgi:hypothetical protein